MRQALLLAGGKGTRLRPLTVNMPKPMAPVGNKPWLERLILHLKQQGIDRFVIAVQHYREHIERHFRDGSPLGVDIAYAIEEKALGTAGAIKNAEPLLDDRFLVFNADIICAIEIEPLLAFHQKHGGAVTIGLTEVDDPSQYGVVDLAEDGAVRRFVEKPSRREAPSRLINAGIYVMERRALEAIPAGKEVSVERETFPALISSGAGVYGTPIRGYWMDMGTKARYRQVHWDLLDGSIPMILNGQPKGEGIWIGEDVSIGRGVELVPPVLIGNGVRIGEQSVIGPYAVIGDGCEIGKDVQLSRTILWDRCRVRDAAQLIECIFGYDLEIGRRHILHEAVMNRIAARPTRGSAALAGGMRA